MSAAPREPIMVRVPSTVKRLVEEAARANERSVDAEVRQLLVRTYTPPTHVPQCNARVVNR